MIWGSRAAVDVMRERGGSNMHLINMGSLSSLVPVPGLAVYGATKHAMLGFSASLQGELMAAGVRITVHAICPDSADTDLVHERAGDADSAILWSAPRLLGADEVAEDVVGLLDTRRLVHVIPRWRGWGARGMALSGRSGLRTAELMRKLGERRRSRG